MIKFILQKHKERLNKFKAEREDWIKFSIVALTSILLILLDLFLVNESKLIYTLIGSGLIIAALWWFWTMRIIKEILNHKVYEVEILQILVNDLKDIKKTISS